MPKFLTIGYGDQAGYDRTPAVLRDAAHAHDDRLRKAGAVMGIAGHPVQVRATPNAPGWKPPKARSWPLPCRWRASPLSRPPI